LASRHEANFHSNDLTEVHRSLGRIEGMIGEMKDANDRRGRSRAPWEEPNRCELRGQPTTTATGT
jgi:hypothetical protein